jgi:signal transduction histidine kinase
MVERLDAAAMRQLQFILFEAFSNVLQHSGASRLLVQADAHGGGIRLCIADNGEGFDTGAAKGNGVPQMVKRADAIGARLALHSQAGRTEVRLELPLRRDAAPLALGQEGA